MRKYDPIKAAAYRQTPKEKERRKQYYLDNRDRIVEKRRIHYEKNKERLNEQKREVRKMERYVKNKLPLLGLHVALQGPKDYDVEVAFTKEDIIRARGL